MSITRDTGSSFPVTLGFTDAFMVPATSAAFSTSASVCLIVVCVAWRNNTASASPHTVAWNTATPAGASAFTQVKAISAAAGNIASSIWTATTTSPLTNVHVDTSVSVGDSQDCASITIDALTGAQSTIGASSSATSDAVAINRALTVTGVVAGSWLYVALSSDGAVALTTVASTTTLLETLEVANGMNGDVGVNTSGTSGSISVGWTGTQAFNAMVAVEIKAISIPTYIAPQYPDFPARKPPQLSSAIQAGSFFFGGTSALDTTLKINVGPSSYLLTPTFTPTAAVVFVPSVFPDAPPRGPAQLPVHNQQFLAYVDSTITFDPASGFPYPTYPDFASRAPTRLPEADQQFIAYTPAINSWGLDFGRPWSPVYPDSVRGLTFPVQEQQFTAYVPAINRWGLDFGKQATVVYPDAVRGLTYPTPDQQFLAQTAVVLLFNPVYPDSVRGLTFPTHEQQFTAYVPAINRWGLDNGQWYPIYPDFAGRATPSLPVADQQALAYVPAINRWGLDFGRPWSPVYPDSVRGLTFPVTNQQYSSFLDWQPFVGVFNPSNGFPYSVYPDIVRGPARLWEGNQQFIAYVPAINRWGIDGNQSPWDPTYPDFPGRKAPSVADFPALSWGNFTPPVFNPNTGFPYPTYPDFAGRNAPSLLVANQQFLAYTPAINRWGLDFGRPWSPVYPDSVRALTFPVQEQQFLAFLDRQPFLINPAAGYPYTTYPDSIYRPTFPVVAQQALAWSGFTPAPLQWYPTYPDFARASPRTIEYPYVAYTPAVNRWGLDFGRPWSPVYPDSVRSLTFPVQDQQFSAFVNSTVFFNPGNGYPYTTYPDYIYAKVSLAVTSQAFLAIVPPQEAIIRLAGAAILESIGLPWLPTYPSRIPPPLGILTADQQFLAWPVPQDAVVRLAGTSTLDVIKLLWSATYPDRILPQVSLPVTHQQFLAWPIPQESIIRLAGLAALESINNINRAAGLTTLTLEAIVRVAGLAALTAASEAVSRLAGNVILESMVTPRVAMLVQLDVLPFAIVVYSGEEQTAGSQQVNTRLSVKYGSYEPSLPATPNNSNSTVVADGIPPGIIKVK